MKPTILFILGPTSSGKTKVSYSLACRINGEILSCDSMQIYKGMDVLTQAPSEELTKDIKHYFVREIAPSDEFNVSLFSEKSKRHIKNILDRGKVPIFSGGTGLYVKSLVDGLFLAPSRDATLRRKLENFAEEKGKGFLYEELNKVDPFTARKLHVNDTRRVIRALEVYKLTGKTISEMRHETVGILGEYNCVMFGLNLPRQILYSKINFTVDKMFDIGVVEEVKTLIDNTLSVTAEKALGIKEICAFLSGEKTLEEAKEELKKHTRNYAKRQLTWFRTDDRIRWINANRSVEEIVEDISDIV